MPHKKFPRNAPCPCGSGKKYRVCCYDKGFKYLVDEDGTVVKSVSMSEGLERIIEVQQRKFQETHGRDMGPTDIVFFDAPPPEFETDYLVEAMKRVGIDPAIIFAVEKTGLVVTEERKQLLTDKDLADWEAAIAEYEAQHGDEELPEDGLPEDDENKWF